MKRSRSEIIFDTLNVTLMVLFAFICIYPFFYVLVVSFNDGKDAMRGGLFLFPREFSLENYTAIFQDKRLTSSFVISAFRTVVGTGLAVVVNSLYAYAVSKRDLPFRKVFNWLIVIPMYFGGGIIPYFLICQGLGLTDTVWVYIIPWLITPFHVMLLRVNMEEFPESLEESAQLDGAGYLRIFVQIVLPLSMPAIATITLLAGITHWNDWLDGSIMVSDSRLWPMQTLLLNILQGADMASFFKDKNLSSAGSMVKKINITPESIKMAMLVITVVPIFMIYPFAQRFFIKGIMVGSVKG